MGVFIGRSPLPGTVLTVYLCLLGEKSEFDHLRGKMGGRCGHGHLGSHKLKCGSGSIAVDGFRVSDIWRARGIRIPQNHHTCAPI